MKYTVQQEHKHWVPQGLSGFWFAIAIMTSYLAAVVLGVANLHPLTFLNSTYPVGSFLWSGLTMWLCTGLFICAHDAMHGLILPRSPKANAIVGQLCLGLYAGLSYKSLLRGHIAHHAHPSTEEDPDYWPSKLGPAGWYGRFMLSYLTPLPIILVAGTYHTMVHVVGIAPYSLITMWIIPQVLSSVQLFYFGTYLPHRPGHPFEGEGLYKARSNSYPTWLSLLTCYHFGYHYAHHRAPWVPWWRLPQYRTIILKEVKEVQPC
jgi:beta-carotene ketolase (CrtW type)